MDITPATLVQVKAAKNGRMVLIEEDVLDVARRLKEIDPCLRLRYAEAGGYYVVYEVRDGKESLVLTSKDLTPSIVEKVRRAQMAHHNLARELEESDRKRKAAEDHAFHEEFGPKGERLAFALRKDLAAKNRIFLPKGV